MKVGAELLDTIARAQRLLERFTVRPEEVGPVVQERRFRDTFSDPSKGGVNGLLTSKDFKAHYEAAMEGTSYRASEAKKVEKAYEKCRASYHHDSFTAFTRVKVALM